MHEAIEEIEFTILDTETTGLDPESGDRIIELAAIRFKGEKQLGSFDSLVNPHRPVSPGAFLVNKITREMLEEAAEIKEVMPRFLDFIQGSCICSYNAAFDLGFLNNELKLLGLNALEDFAIIDILTMARRLLPSLSCYALKNVAENFGIRALQEHRAFSDCRLTLEVFNKLKAILKDKGITDFNNFNCLFGWNCKALEDLNRGKKARIQEAIDLGAKIRIKYLARHNALVTERELSPCLIKQDRMRTYVVGYCYLRKEERTFSLDGILHLEIV